MLTANFFIQATGLARRLSGRWYSPITNCLMNFCKKKIRLKKKIKKSVIVTSIHSSSISAYPAEHHRAYSIMHRWRRREYPGSGIAVWAYTHRDARPACLDSRRYELTPRIWLWGSSANIHNKKKKHFLKNRSEFGNNWNNKSGLCIKAGDIYCVLNTNSRMCFHKRAS